MAVRRSRRDSGTFNFRWGQTMEEKEELKKLIKELEEKIAHLESVIDN